MEINWTTLMKSAELLLRKAVEEGFTYPLSLEIINGDGSSLAQLRFDTPGPSIAVFPKPTVEVHFPVTMRLTDAEGRALGLKSES